MRKELVVVKLQVVVSTRSQEYLASLTMRVMMTMRITVVQITAVDMARKITESYQITRHLDRIKTVLVSHPVCRVTLASVNDM